MAEYIEREALLENLRNSHRYHAGNSREESLLYRDIRIVNEQPAADVVPVVRCKDCKYGEVDEPEDFPDQYYCHEGCGWNKGDFFCSYGERKEAEGNG